MSGSAEAIAGPDAGEPSGAGHSGGSRWGRHRGIWAGLVIGVIVVSGALVAVLQDSGGGTDPDQRPEVLDPVEVTHEFPAGYAGQVWITVAAPDRAPRSVTIQWGPWEKRFVHESAEPETYWFTKAPPEPGDENVPATVRVEPGAEVRFDQGSPPVGAHDRSAGWEPAG